MRKAATRSELGGVSLHQSRSRHPHCGGRHRSNRRRRLRPEVERIRLSERDAEPLRVDRAEVGRVAVSDQLRIGPTVPRRHVDVRSRCFVVALAPRPDRAGPGRGGSLPPRPSKRTVGRSCPAARVASTTRCAHRGSDGSSPSPRCSAMSKTGQGQISLRRRRTVQRSWSQTPSASGSHHRCAGVGQVLLRIDAVTDPNRAPCRTSQVEAVATVLRWSGACVRCRGGAPWPRGPPGPSGRAPLRRQRRGSDGSPSRAGATR